MSGNATIRKPRSGSASSKIEVRNSSIHGRGVFALAKLRKGALIGTFEGPDTTKDGMHVLWVEEEDGWRGVSVENEMRYLNHSYDPNADAEGTELRALRSIEKGEEITFHYGDEWEDVE